MTDHGLMGLAIGWLRAKPKDELWLTAAGFGTIIALVALHRLRGRRARRVGAKAS
ncbi:MAG TPA: hypothetical protein VH639_24565 [Bryobacteraceae bacterium]|jgi:hypothetical protein